jgi:hypothetical protein
VVVAADTEEDVSVVQDHAATIDVVTVGHQHRTLCHAPTRTVVAEDSIAILLCILWHATEDTCMLDTFLKGCAGCAQLTVDICRWRCLSSELVLHCIPTNIILRLKIDLVICVLSHVIMDICGWRYLSADWFCPHQT